MAYIARRKPNAFITFTWAVYSAKIWFAPEYNRV